jgi:acetyltransferase-like isoleucine patch superfamily enzyme
VTLLPGDTVLTCLWHARKTAFWRICIRPLRHVFPFIMRHDNNKLKRDAINFVKTFMEKIPQDKIVITEGTFISPDVAINEFDLSCVKLAIIGYPNADVEQKMHDIRKYNRGVSQLRNKPDEQLRPIVQNYVNLSSEYQNFAQKHGVAFIDTSHDYHGAINDFAKNIAKFFLENFVFILKNFCIFAIYEKNEKYPWGCCNVLIPCELWRV